MLNTQTFITVINIKLQVGQLYNFPYVDITAKDLHTFIGGYPGVNHRMPVCNSAMRAIMTEGDIIPTEPPNGQGASLTIRYFLPRP